jgi:hypothetical protein
MLNLTNYQSLKVQRKTGAPHYSHCGLEKKRECPPPDKY